MNGLVLAGGRGLRMGGEKGALLHPDGRTMLRRTVDILKEAGCENVVVSARDGQEFEEKISGMNMVRDSGDGPLGGMIAGIETDPTADWLVVACDLPRLTAAVLKELLGFPEYLVVYERDGRLEPLCGFYAAGAVEIFRKSRDAGVWSLQKILRGNGAKIIHLADDRVLENANTPVEWAQSMDE